MHASIMPLDRNDTIWLYVSDAFFRNITGPHYRIEMARRLQAAADIELVQLAKLAAASEAQPGETIEQLKAASLLPPEFGPLPDGSRVVLEDGEVVDYVRGHRGAVLAGGRHARRQGHAGGGFRVPQVCRVSIVTSGAGWTL